MSKSRICKKCGCQVEGACVPCKKAAMKEWRGKNVEKVKASRLKYLVANVEKVALGKRRWSQENPEKVKLKNANYQANFPEKTKALRVAWNKANPNAGRVKNSNRRARKRENGGRLSKDLSDKLFKLQKGKCPCCKKLLGDKYHVDHVIPLKLEGQNLDKNIQLLCASCNLSKGCLHPIDFMQSRGFLL